LRVVRRAALRAGVGDLDPYGSAREEQHPKLEVAARHPAVRDGVRRQLGHDQGGGFGEFTVVGDAPLVQVVRREAPGETGAVRLPEGRDRIRPLGDCLVQRS
jgi:hypothetical protein